MMWPEHLVFVVLGLTSVFSAVAGFLGGRHLSDRALDVAYDEGQEEGWHACDLAWQTFIDSPEPDLTRPVAVVAEPEGEAMACWRSELAWRDRIARDPDGTPAGWGKLHEELAWRDQIEHDLSPEALEAAAADCVCGEINSRHCPVHNDVPGPGSSDEDDIASVYGHDAGPGYLHVSRPETCKPGNASSEGRELNSAGPGHLTPAQRRRDKHKQRRQYAPEAEREETVRWEAFISACPVCRPGQCLGPDPGCWYYEPEDGEPEGIDWTGELAAIRCNGQTDWYTAMMAQVA